MTTPPSSLSALAAEHGLVRVGVRPSLPDYVRQVWSRRHFAVAMAASKAYARNQGSYLGQLWSVLSPLLNSLVKVTGIGADRIKVVGITDLAKRSHNLR